jgi:importin subunit alpha-2
VNTELPKAKKEDDLLKRHNLEIGDEPLSPFQEQNCIAAANMSIEDIVNGMCTVYVCGIFFLCSLKSHLNLYHVGINSGEESKEMTATHAARKILTRECEPPIDILINANVVPRLVEFLSRVNKYVVSLLGLQTFLVTFLF